MLLNNLSGDCWRHPSWNLPTSPNPLDTDASLEGLGAVLSQVQEGQECVIAYASHSLSRTERNDQNYISFQAGAAGLKLAVTEKFKDFLWGA